MFFFVKYLIFNRSKLIDMQMLHYPLMDFHIRKFNYKKKLKIIGISEVDQNQAILKGSVVT